MGLRMYGSFSLHYGNFLSRKLPPLRAKEFGDLLSKDLNVENITGLQSPKYLPILKKIKIDLLRVAHL